VALIINDRNKIIFGCFKGSLNTSAASTSKLLNFAASTIITNGITVVSASVVSVGETGLYSVSLTIGAVVSAASVMTYSYSINGIFTTISTSVSALYSCGRFSLLIPLKENDQLSFRVSTPTAVITSVYPGMTTTAVATSPLSAMTIKKV
jgi:hypothetical protein